MPLRPVDSLISSTQVCLELAHDPIWVWRRQYTKQSRDRQSCSCSGKRCNSFNVTEHTQTLQSAPNRSQCNAASRTDTTKQYSQFLQADTRTCAVALTELPGGLLECVLGFVTGMELLQTRSNVALVSKSFAMIIKQQQTVTILSSNFVGRNEYLGVSTFGPLFAALRHVICLDLPDAERHTLAKAISCATCCPLLKVLSFHLRPEGGSGTDPSICHLIPIFVVGSSLRLRVLIVKANGCVQYQAVSQEGSSCQQDGLKCVTAGSLTVLRNIAAGDVLPAHQALERQTWLCCLACQHLNG